MAWWAISTELYREQRFLVPMNLARAISLQLHRLHNWVHSYSSKLLSSVAQIKAGLLFFLFFIIYCSISTACVNYPVKKKWLIVLDCWIVPFIFWVVVSDTYLSMAEIYRKQGDNTLAIISYSSAIQCSPTDDDIYFRRAELYFEENQLLLAMDDYAKVSSLFVLLQ